jgi:hypothetical protein
MSLGTGEIYASIEVYKTFKRKENIVMNNVVRIFLVIIIVFFMAITGSQLFMARTINKFYDKGYDAGHRHGYNDAWINFSMQEARWNAYKTKYGSIHDTPWEEFDIREKMFLVAYGSSGNRFSDKDLDEIEKKFGGR